MNDILKEEHESLGHRWNAVGLVDVPDPTDPNDIISAIAQSCECGAVRAVAITTIVVDESAEGEHR